MEKQSIKICDLCVLYYSHGGGIKTYIDNKRLVYQKNKIQHILIAPNEKNPKQLEKIQTGSLISYYVPCVKFKLFGTAYVIFKNFKTIESILEKERPDVIEIGDKITTLFFKEKIKKIHQKIKTKIFGFVHERSDNFAINITGSKTLGNLIARIFNKRFLHSVQEVITNSEFTSKEISKYLQKNKLHILHLGINVATFKNFKNAKTTPDKKKIIIHVGRLDKDKKVDLLIKIAEKIDPKKYTLVIAGGGSLEDKLKKIPAVNLLGYVSQTEVKKYLSTADLGILVNDVEPYGLVGLEMMSAGMAILAPKDGGLITFLKKDFAFFCEHTPESYLAALNSWAKMSEKQKNAMGQSATKEAKKYTIENMVEKLLAIYKHK